LFDGNFALTHPDAKSGSGVAFFAHIGGFVFGVLVALVLSRAGHISARTAPDVRQPPTATYGGDGRLQY
jgi:membrane associated rhomboid family serine protease